MLHLQLLTLYHLKKSIFFFLIFFSYSYSFASKVQWAKFLKDTTRDISARNYFIQGECTDSLNNIYFCYAKNGVDTNLSFITKMSPDGEIIWHKSLFPFELNSQIYNRFDANYQVHIDSDQHLIIAGALWDTTGYTQNGFYQRKLFFKKWDMNGIQISEKVIPLAAPPNNQGSNAFLSDTKLMPNGDIYLSHYFSDNMSCYSEICGVNKNFDSVFSVQIPMPDDSITHAGRPPLMAITDSSITLVYSRYTYGLSDINRIFLLQFSIATADTNWIKVREEYGDYYTKRQIEIFDNHIYMAGNGIEKYSSSGDSISFNRDYKIHNFAIDSLGGNLYGVSLYQQNINIYRYDTNLNLLSTISPPVTTGMKNSLVSIRIRDSLLITHGFTNDSNDNDRIFSVDIIKADFAGNIIQSAKIHMESPVFRFEYPKNDLLIDNMQDVILIGAAYFTPLDDTGNVKLYSYPIFACKIAFDTNFNLSGKIFIDDYANCQIDPNETGLENNLVRLMPEDIYTFSDSTGFYSFKKANGTANIEYIPFINGLNNCIANGTHTVTVNNNAIIDTLNFGMHPVNIYYDARCKLYTGVSRPGFIQRANVLVQNISSAKIHNVKAVLTLDSMYTFQTATVPPDSIVGNKLYWSFDSMSIGKIANIFIDLHTTPLLNLGYHYQHSLLITADGDTLLVANNRDTSNGNVIGSFDPNHKIASPVGIGSEHYIDNNTVLTYNIEFQNTGTDTAFNIKLVDELDQNLDLSTLVINGSSHKLNYALQNRTLSFFFNNILLPDSNKNYQKSIGFVAYSLKPKPDILGKKIKNKASIFFDFNAPIITNTTSHTIGLIHGKINYEDDQLIAYPIPLKGKLLNIYINIVSTGNASLELYDINGRKLMTLFNKYIEKGVYQYTVDNSLFYSNQLYFMSLTTSNSKKTIGIVK